MIISPFIRATFLIAALALSATGYAQDVDAQDQELAQTQSIDVNTADATALAELDNVGESKAQAIIEYRESKGRFTAVDELKNVKGIGAATIEKNRHRMVAGQ